MVLDVTECIFLAQSTRSYFDLLLLKKKPEGTLAVSNRPLEREQVLLLLHSNFKVTTQIVIPCHLLKMYIDKQLLYRQSIMLCRRSSSRQTDKRS